MKKTILLLICIMMSVGIRAQQTPEEFFAQIPTTFPLEEEIAYAIFYNKNPDNPQSVAAHKNYNDFVSKVARASVLQGISSSVNEMKNLGLDSQVIQQYTQMIQQVQNPTEKDDEDEEDVEEEEEEDEDNGETGEADEISFFGTSGFTISASRQSERLSTHAGGGIPENHFAENGWNEDLEKWIEEYSAKEQEVLDLEEDFRNTVEDYNAIWYRESSSIVSKNNKQMEVENYEMAVAQIDLDWGDESAEARIEAHEKAIKRLDQNNRSTKYKWALEKLKKTMPKVSKILQKMKENIAYKKGMDKFMRSQGSTGKNSHLNAAMQRYAYYVQIITLLTGHDIPGL